MNRFDRLKIKNTVKFPTSLIIGGLSRLGIEIAESLVEQGGYVIIVDSFDKKDSALLDVFPKDALISLVDYTAISHLDEEVRRLDYIFFMTHESYDLHRKVPSQQFLNFSNYLDAALSLASKFEAKFLLSTAIKAHQLVLSTQDFALNYISSPETRHNLYTEMELQRYAESLVIEYVEKVSLDARIVRLGEMIGDGMDFTAQSTFTELIIKVAQSGILKLKKDGLETEWLVHLLDAAYGIIKAQFSKNTKGETYSICYENNFTHLSIAYKIQEIEEGAQEIQFVNEQDNLPPLKLYRPAPNLSKIGWMPRINFEKALKQSLASAKLYLLANGAKRIKNQNGNTFVEKIKSFLNIADSNSITGNLEDEYAGPVTELIEERKRQEELKYREIEYASNKIKVKRKKKPRTFYEKAQSIIWKNLIALGKTFSFFKNRTPLELVLFGVAAMVVILLYFYIFSPAIALTRNYLVLAPSYSSLKQSFLDGNYSELKSKSEEVFNVLEDSSFVLNRYEGILNLFGLSKEYFSVKSYIDAAGGFAEGLKNLGYALEPFLDLLSSYDNNIQLRTSTDSYVSVSSSESDYKSYLTELEQRAPYLELAEKKISQSIDVINNIDLNNVPDFLFNAFLEAKGFLTETQKTVLQVISAKYLPELMGLNTTQTYLFFILDNTRLKPVGGDISAYILITVKDGVINEAVVQSIDELKNSPVEFSADIIKQINLQRFTYINNPSVSDLGNILNYDKFGEASIQVFEQIYNRDIKGVGVLNYNALDSFLKSFDNFDYLLKIDGAELPGENILSDVRLSLGNDQSLAGKNRISAQVFSSLFNYLLENIGLRYTTLFKNLNTGTNNSDILFYMPTGEYKEYIRQNFLTSTLPKTVDSFIKPSISFEDNKIPLAEAFSTVNIATKLIITADLKLLYKLNFKFPVLGTSQEVSICLPGSVETNTIFVEGVVDSRKVINSLEDEKCVVIKALSESQVTVSWQQDSYLDSTKNEAELEIVLTKVRGAKNISDFEITLQGSWKFTTISPSVNINNNSAVFTKELDTNQLILLQLSK